MTPRLLTRQHVAALRERLDGRVVVLCFGAGVDSTAMLVILREAGIVPSLILFADTGGEKPETLIHLARVNVVLAQWGWPLVTVVRKVPLASTGYSDLYGNCLKNETLPSLAFGLKSCSLKWKVSPQDQYLKGVSKGPNKCPPHPAWMDAVSRNERVVKLIGYDCGKADIRRSKDLKPSDDDFDYVYPLQLVGWFRSDCVDGITKVMGSDLVPIKSACFFCPASKQWELYWLAAEHPDLLEAALRLEWRALTGRHSRFSEVEFGAAWEDMVRAADSFPSTNTCVGLGRSFAWNQWARVNGVVDAHFRVIRGNRALFLSMAASLRQSDNALDARGKAVVTLDQLRGARSSNLGREEVPA